MRRDKFVERTFDWAHWAETHRREMIAAVVGVVVLIAGFFVYRDVSRGAEEEAARDYLMARQGYFAGNYQLAVSDLQQFVDRHGGSSYEDDALLFLGEAQIQAGAPDEAIVTLEELLDDHGGSPLADNARRLLAVAYAEAGQTERAVETYRAAIEDAPYDELKAQLHQSLARLYESQSMPEEAAAEYRAVIDLDPDGPVAQAARREIAELTIRPLSGATAGGAEGTASATPPEPAAP